MSIKRVIEGDTRNLDVGSCRVGLGFRVRGS